MLNYDHIMENRQDLIHVPYRPMFYFVCLFCMHSVKRDFQFKFNDNQNKNNKREKRKTKNKWIINQIQIYKNKRRRKEERKEEKFI